MLLPSRKLSSPTGRVSSAPGPGGSLLCHFAARKRLLATRLPGRERLAGRRTSDKPGMWVVAHCEHPPGLPAPGHLLGCPDPGCLLPLLTVQVLKG